MALANDMTTLLNKIERRLGLIQLTPFLPEYLQKPEWANVIETDTMVTFSRYFPYEFKMTINDDTCYKEKDSSGTTWYYIKDELLEGVKLLGIKDIDWMDYSTNNNSLGATSLGGGYYYPNFACPEATFDSVISLQMAADMSSLYNRGVYIDFKYPNKFAVKGLGNTNYDLNTFVVILLVQHRSLSTISPTKMEVFESLAQADIANFLWMNLRYDDGLETAYINIDLKLAELQDHAQRRDGVIEELKNGYVSASNDNQPLIWTV